MTFSDLMSLLLTFFILLVSMSEIKKGERLDRVLGSVRQAFGGEPARPGTMPNLQPPVVNAIFEQLKAIEPILAKTAEGDGEEEGIDGGKWRVTDIRKGVKVEIGGGIAFERFSALLMPEGQKLVEMAADTIKGRHLKITVRGHATNEPLPPDSPYADPMDLSFARAKAVVKELIRDGLQPERITCVAAGDTEPLAAKAYDEARRAINRRVEVIVTEDTVQDYFGEPIRGEGLLEGDR